jgi:diguanylate cyclase (GGDEF)-like protein
VRFTRLFLLTTALLLTLVSLMLARALWVDWRAVRAAESGLQAMALAHRVMLVAEKASAERGPTIPVLNDGEPVDPARRQRLSEFRVASDAAMVEALNALAASEGPPSQQARSLLLAAQAQLAAARAEVDRVAALPVQERKAPGSTLTRQPINAMFAVIDSVFEPMTLLSGEAERIHPTLSLPLVGARYAAELREVAGRLGSQFTTPLATQQPLGAAERRDIPFLVGRITQLNQLLQVKARTSLTTPEIQSALAEMQRRYFETGLPFIATLTAAGLEGRPNAYGIESAAFVARYVPEMKSIVQLRDQLYQSGRAAAEAEVAAARRRMAVNAALGGAVLFIEIGVFLTLRRRVLLPLLRNTAAMRRVMRGEWQDSLPEGHNRDEVGELQQAVRALRDAGRVRRELEEEREHLIAELRRASSTDHLTGLLNRAAFEARSRQLLAQSQRSGAPIALLLFDIDHFKSINDLRGHAMGDAVLRRVAQTAAAHFREADLLARFGGEEFIALLPDTDGVGALQMAERLRGQLAEVEHEGLGGVAVTASFGVAAAQSGESGGMDALFRAADAALYRAKQLGRNRVRSAADAADLSGLFKA